MRIRIYVAYGLAASDIRGTAQRGVEASAAIREVNL